MEKKELIGKKVKGFQFDVASPNYVLDMDKHIGEVGKITQYFDSNNSYRVNFVNKSWIYPSELIEQHLVEENLLDNLPIIGEGVLMEVSDDSVNWVVKDVFAKYKNSFVAWTDHEHTISIQLWKQARPINPKTKITRKEFEQKFEIID